MPKLTSALYLPFLVIGASALTACHFEMQAGNDPKHPHPNNGVQPAPPPAPAPAPAGDPTHAVKHTGVWPTPANGNTTPPATSPVAPPPSGSLIVNAQTIFGGPTVNPAGYKGNIYRLPAGATTLPNLSTLTPVGYLFSGPLNVAPQNFSTGFPGVDATLNQNFAIHYEGPLVVQTESDYSFRLVADDGAQIRVDGTQASGAAPIVNGDGIHANANSVTGPVHLVVGTHIVAIDYFQGPGHNVALQFFCTKTGGSEQICPSTLP